MQGQQLIRVSKRSLHDEQRKIVVYLGNILERYRLIEVKSNEQIQLMQESRTALISAAVTGKIDVRGWQAPL